MLAWAVGVFLYIKEKSTLQLTDEGVRFDRPGVPLFGWGKAHLRFDWSDVSRVVIEPRSWGTFKRLELRIESGREAIRVNMEHAHRDGETRPVAASLPRDRWAEHPLVQEVAERADTDVEVL